MNNEETGPDRVLIRRVKMADNPLLGEIIRGCFRDYDATREGTVFSDPVIDRLYESFDRERSAYFVLEIDGVVMGGAGIQPLKGADGNICELQKMYLQKQARGRGLGRALLDQCLLFARKAGFRVCYLESLPELRDALRMYERAGFEYIPERLGNTGYYGCTRYMQKTL